MNIYSFYQTVWLLLRRNSAAIAPVAGVFLFLPQILDAFILEKNNFVFSLVTSFDKGTSFLPFSSTEGFFLVFGLLFSLFGYLPLTSILLGNAGGSDSPSITVAEHIRRSTSLFPSFLWVCVLVFLVLLFAFTLVVMGAAVFALLLAKALNLGPQFLMMSGAISVIVLASFILLSRLLPLVPAFLKERRKGLSLIRYCWGLSRGHTLLLLKFYFLLMMASIALNFLAAAFLEGAAIMLSQQGGHIFFLFNLTVSSVIQTLTDCFVIAGGVVAYRFVKQERDSRG